MLDWSKLLLDKFGLERKPPDRIAIDPYTEDRLREYERVFGVPYAGLRDALQHYRARKEAFKDNRVNCEQLFIAGFVIGSVETKRMLRDPSGADLDRVAEEEKARRATLTGMSLREPGEEG